MCQNLKRTNKYNIFRHSRESRRRINAVVRIYLTSHAWESKPNGNKERVIEKLTVTESNAGRFI